MLTEAAVRQTMRILAALGALFAGVGVCATVSDGWASTTRPAETTQPLDWPPKPKAASEFQAQRERMVQSQMARPSDFRDAVTDAAVLDAMRAVPRHAFVPDTRRPDAYQDSPLPIGHGQTISQPYIVALMTEQLKLKSDSKVLEIGTGSGYQAAVLAHLTPHVNSIEIIEPLAARARKVLDEQGYTTVQTKRADGYHGWKEHAPFDAIIVTAAAGHVPGPLWQQLAPGGQMVIPVGGAYEVQRLLVLTKQPDGTRKSRTVTDVRFVPMTGQAQRQ
jgi:protein-L-isoaspartate(D-aspartate) O-methyltransferase